MKNKDSTRWLIGACVLLTALMFIGCATYPLPDGARTHVTSTVSTLDNDGIVLHVLNYSDMQKTIRARIYRNTGAGAVQVTDSGTIAVAATWQWGLGYTVQESGEYWVELDVSSEALVPKVSFERHDGAKWVPFVTYSPGDFAVYDPQRRRLW